VIINEAYYVLKINGLCLGSINPVSLEVNLWNLFIKSNSYYFW
jgi:hypothetical protein